MRSDKYWPCEDPRAHFPGFVQYSAGYEPRSNLLGDVPVEDCEDEDREDDVGDALDVIGCHVEREAVEDTLQ